ncbi:hypothetical protein J6500_04710 [Bradyrhizobium sp. WSM 1704]|uniref:hypothetical protein n=1 Tax=Bradyrhizobium semiaridum TaxID=2821404 RepID=UPI001CE37E45|nr:hypothetical protein [Bradyrhizobium semiaridum]MCA6121208.1 hypothetical protein [Bradyrhizobium semiaridum]
MLENISKYWALLTVAAFAVVSVFNIGYFYIIGLHFIGVMDLTNVIYSVGLVLGFLLPPLFALPVGAIEDFRKAAKQPDALSRYFKPIKWASWAVIAFFCVALFFTHNFLSTMTLFSITFGAAAVFGSLVAYIAWQSGASRSWVVLAGPLSASALAIFWIGGNIADHEARFSKTTYRITTKDAEYSEARLVRSSSTGFIVSHDKRFMFVPSGEVKSIAQMNPYVE